MRYFADRKPEMRKTNKYRFCLNELEKPIDLIVHTKVPHKWIFIDIENPGIWAFSGVAEKEKMFRKADLIEILEAKDVIDIILKKHGDENDV
jgi:hypothetical protein